MQSSFVAHAARLLCCPHCNAPLLPTLQGSFVALAARLLCCPRFSCSYGQLARVNSSLDAVTQIELPKQLMQSSLIAHAARLLCCPHCKAPLLPTLQGSFVVHDARLLCCPRFSCSYGHLAHVNSLLDAVTQIEHSKQLMQGSYVAHAAFAAMNSWLDELMQVSFVAHAAFAATNSWLVP